MIVTLHQWGNRDCPCRTCEVERSRSNPPADVLAAAEHAVLEAARALARAQVEVEAALDAWMDSPDRVAEGPEHSRVTAARLARNAAADRLYDIASRELAQALNCHDVPPFLKNRQRAAR